MSKHVVRRAATAALVTTALLTGSFSAVANATAASASGPVQSGMLESGTNLLPGEERVSANRRYRLRMQTDGNLVVLDRKTVIWHTGTGGKPGLRARMQTDGNLVLLEGLVPRWSSGTHSAGATAHVQNDGNLTIRSTYGAPIWARR